LALRLPLALLEGFTFPLPLLRLSGAIPALLSCCSSAGELAVLALVAIVLGLWDKLPPTLLRLQVGSLLVSLTIGFSERVQFGIMTSHRIVDWLGLLLGHPVDIQSLR